MLFVNDVLAFKIPMAKLPFSGRLIKVEQLNVDGLFKVLVDGQLGRRVAVVLDVNRGAVVNFNGDKYTAIGAFEKLMHC